MTSLRVTSPTRTLLTAAALLALVLSASAPAHAQRRSVQKKKAVALQQFEKAEQVREALNGRPAKQRSRAEYNRLLARYRQVYYTAPTSPKANVAVVRVAELLAEMGRLYNEEKFFHYAIRQYGFLFREYPGSRYRFDGLFATGQIYWQDLDDRAKAKETFQQFLAKYPNHRLAEDARRAITDIDAEEVAARKREQQVAARKKQPAPKPSARKEEPAPEPPPAEPAKRVMVTGLRHWSTGDYTRVALDIEGEVKYQAGRIADPERIFFDLLDTKLVSELVGKALDVEGNSLLKRIRLGQYQQGVTRVVLEVSEVSEYSAFLLPNPHRLIIDIHGKQPTAAAAKSVEPPTAAPAAPEPKQTEVARDSERQAKPTSQPTSAPTFESVAPRAEKKQPEPEVEVRTAKPASNGDRSLIRALGLKIGRIVIDAGHGGHDTGTIGPGGLAEKELVLDVALRLGKMLEERLGAEVVYTRDDDTFVPLETRTAIANQKQADLFISIHANASRDRAARGVETYYLNFTSSRDALEVAARENAVSEKSIYELQDLVKKIAMKEKIEESREFAGEVQSALHASLVRYSRAIRNRGVKQAPFIVLIGANMPSILAEVSFLTNPTEEKNLRRPAHRQRIAESLFKGISNYAEGLSGVKVAARDPRQTGK